MSQEDHTVTPKQETKYQVRVPSQRQTEADKEQWRTAVDAADYAANLVMQEPDLESLHVDVYDRTGNLIIEVKSGREVSHKVSHPTVEAELIKAKIDAAFVKCMATI